MEVRAGRSTAVRGEGAMNHAPTTRCTCRGAMNGVPTTRCTFTRATNPAARRIERVGARFIAPSAPLTLRDRIRDALLAPLRAVGYARIPLMDADDASFRLRLPAASGA